MDELWNDIHLAALPPPTLQDFLTGPAPTAPPSSAADAAACSCSHRPPALTVLSLSSGPGFQFVGNSGGDAAAAPCFVKRKAAAENDDDDRGKRLMKNRDSASRSRARKQAYMDELEVELANLQKENAKLRMQQLQLRLALPAAALLPKKTNLRRTLTAPF